MLKKIEIIDSTNIVIETAAKTKKRKKQNKTKNKKEKRENVNDTFFGISVFS